MSDVSNFVRRSGSADRTEINKILAVINPLAFPVVENEALKERIVLSPHVRKRTNTVLSGTDITDSSIANRTRKSSAITLLPSSATYTAFPVSETLTGTLTFDQSKFGGGAIFTGSQYISIPDNTQFDLTLPYFTMAFWFKGNGIDQGAQTIWNKGNLAYGQDFCSACTDFSDDYITTVDNPITSGLQIRVQGNISQDHCSACTDFDASFDTSTLVEQVRVIISDGINLVDSTVNTTNIFDGNWHSIVIISTDSVSDYCSACTDFDIDDYGVITSPLITVYMDKVSVGTIDHSTITGDLSNSNTAYIGINGELENPLKGSLAIFEYQGTNWTTTDVDSFHDSGRIRVGSQKAAFHFIGNDSSVDTLDKVY